jgi:pimeloyl-ACP methyl ester carboxylesterase
MLAALVKRVLIFLCSTAGVYALTVAMSCGIAGWWYIMSAMADDAERLAEEEAKAPPLVDGALSAPKLPPLNPSLAHAANATPGAAGTDATGGGENVTAALRKLMARERRVVDIDLSGVACGWRCRATVWQGSTYRPALLTVHDAGVDHRDCFESFLQFAAMLPQLGQCSIVHLDFETSEANGDAPGPRTVASMASAITAAADELAIAHIVGFGVGVGATALLHLGCGDPTRFRAFILAGAASSEAGCVERVVGHAVLFCAEHLGMVGLLRATLATRFFSAKALRLSKRARSSPLKSMVTRTLANLTRGSATTATAIAMLKAHLARRALSLAELAKLESVPLLLLARGSDLSASQQCTSCLLAPPRSDSRRVQFATDPGRTSILSARAAPHLAWCEAPGDFTVPVSTFLQGV